jgi:hypothetical protein
VRGSWVGKTLIFASDRFERRTRIGTRKSEPIDDVHAFLPIQFLGWSDGEIILSRFIVHALIDGRMIHLFDFASFEQALKAARQMTDALAKYRATA